MSFAVAEVSYWMALGYGFLAFFSPCVLPLIPAFLGVLFASKGDFLKIIGFFVGISSLFSVIGVLFGLFGNFIPTYILTWISGLALVVFGLFYLFDVELVKMKKNPNVWRYKGEGFLNGFLLGGSVGLVWIPCSSPILGSILAIVASGREPVKGGVLLFLYSLGISIPFILMGGFVNRLLNRVSFKKPVWMNVLKVVGSLSLVLVGVLILTGRFITY
ncbi:MULTISPECIES: cytochrome c biogenesis CcdA family protein [Thermotoga]|uniref:Cytochrome c biogenesis protein, transmembrane region n=1 Tax=Thermotoga petrophila (strain ATCC BAA-488 / DSM 13995 / JCM 10881 / RKU-1) TaxID=390874 RepID=A5IN37_THEP1|nr:MULTISPECIES: cytochrome c biogenesis CcdA family protein [Thermotoga]ABQ47610.1 cytochrome c biogenesis protein, transmembrane region [Thermotoga petrophila RKU-1]ACB10005.1 cytochrome c biogenesis protein transmembrane region [Thermotoga sp. RQ2]AIY88907.1 cytochrome c biogenesis protein transmembrane region [Thermotoga sp. Cell2]KHC91556.1 cytochrome c biogenesis protein transmembrane protein [Thermotoga sp. Mc24]KHC93073.1 cytochrome c biogenesis protein transmembrane protein [Thermotog